jgi:hypothetical protein
MRCEIQSHAAEVTSMVLAECRDQRHAGSLEAADRYSLCSENATGMHALSVPVAAFNPCISDR